ncbi:MAG: hypothetical protein JWM09_1522 [Francisellaceae bacterium]|nr:hypothetical protein [Francisellaceae bacterium]
MGATPKKIAKWKQRQTVQNAVMDPKNALLFFLALKKEAICQHT